MPQTIAARAALRDERLQVWGGTRRLTDTDRAFVKEWEALVVSEMQIRAPEAPAFCVSLARGGEAESEGMLAVGSCGYSGCPAPRERKHIPALAHGPRSSDPGSLSEREHPLRPHRV